MSQLLMLAGEAVAVYLLVLWTHSLRGRIGPTPFYAVLGAITAVMSWVTDAGMAVEFGGLTFVIGSTVFYTALLLGVMWLDVLLFATGAFAPAEQKRRREAIMHMAETRMIPLQKIRTAHRLLTKTKPRRSHAVLPVSLPATRRPCRTAYASPSI